MTKIAIDIVILPPKKISDLSIQISKKLKQRSKKIVLNSSNTLPHISLLMGCISEKKLPLLQTRVRKSLNNKKVLNLKIVKYNSRFLNELQIQKMKSLSTLQTCLLKNCKELLLYNATKKNFVGGNKVSANSIKWVNNFIKNSTEKNYSPHITLGYGKLKEQKVNIPFTATTIAICQLGSNCTCKKILCIFELR